MRKKTFIIILTLLISLISVTVIHKDFEVEANPGGGGETGDVDGINLDFNYMWNVTKEIVDVIHNKNVYPNGSIPKGRYFGTKGDNYTANNILKYDMEDDCGLSDVNIIKIGHLSGSDKLYSNKIVTEDFRLTITHPSKTYPYTSTVPLTEIFPFAAAKKYPWTCKVTHNYSDEGDDVGIYRLKYLDENRGTNWPFGGTYNDYHLNITYEPLNEYSILIGNVSYIESDETIPEYQDGMIFLMNETNDCEEKIENITNATGVILINDYTVGFQYQEATKTNFSVARVNKTTNTNLTNITTMLNNGKYMMTDNAIDNEIITFTYNLSEQNCLPSIDYFLLVQMEDPVTSTSSYEQYKKAWLPAMGLYVINILTLDLVRCHGIIIYDAFDTHFMSYSMRDWVWFGDSYIDNPSLPMFSVNYSVGNWLWENATSSTGYPRADYYLNQTYYKQTPIKPGVDAYNVVGYRNISQSPGDSVVVISNRFDGMWGETPGDSGLGAGIVLGIAKYFNDTNIIPKHNLTFLMTTGEDYGMRGALHFSHSHPDINYTLWIGTDQLGMNQEGVNFTINCNTSQNRDITYAITNVTNYKARNNNKYGGEAKKDIILGTEMKVWKDRCDTIVVEKTGPWRGYHRAGANYAKGDSLNNTDRNDANLSFEVTWNITKYFTVNPDCWLNDVTYEPFDSDNDGDTLDDSIRINYTMDTIIPKEYVMLEVLYDKHGNPDQNNIPYSTINTSVNSSGRSGSIVFTIPDTDSKGDYNVKIRLYNSTGRINKIVGISGTQYNDSSSSTTYHLYHPFGYTTEGNLKRNSTNVIAGSTFTANENGYADNISAYVLAPDSYPPLNVGAKCLLYRKNDSKLIGATDEIYPVETSASGAWIVFNFPSPKPSLVQETDYVIVYWANGSHLYYNNFSQSRGRYDNETYDGTPPDYANFSNESRLYSIYCSYTANNYGPNIENITASPNPVGFGLNVTISADVTDPDGVDTVKVAITKPPDGGGGGELGSNNTMVNIGGETYEYVFNDTWKKGQYNYTIWAVDNKSYSNTSAQYSFNVSGQANITVCTIKDSYTGNEEWINLTDPPIPQIGYELLNNNQVLHVWNHFDSYYFNTSNGIQFTNHFEEYWSHNVLMLGYYNNNQWNLIYRSDNLSGFNKNIISDGKTFVNATLWKNLTYSGYDFQLAIRYHLGVDDNELTVIPYIKNIDNENIPYDLGFAWELKDIMVDMTPEDDYIEVNRTIYYLNNTLDLAFTNITPSSYYIRENKTDGCSESMYLRWNSNLTYKLQVKSRNGQYNAPVTLGIKIGTLDVGQEKYTKMFWHDASEATYYFDSYNVFEAWASNPSYLVDGSTSNFASTTVNDDVERCLSNSYSSNEGTITKVELRAHGYYSVSAEDILLRPVFDGSNDGADYRFDATNEPGWSDWFDITLDGSAPRTWSWKDISVLDCDVEADIGMVECTLYCSKVEIRVTYTPPNYSPSISNPYPSNGATGISIQPELNITVNDEEGDSMTISWLSNSSGSWTEFGTNTSCSNGTYHQTMSNASVNGQWWYWKVNVSDGTDYNESSVFKFYTGYESKIENTGSINISGFLLIQVQFYNGSSWVVADNTIDENTSRIINVGGVLGLDTIFNGQVDSKDFEEFGNGSYRVYAEFRDPDGNVLICDDETEIIATYEFIITF